MKIIIVGSGSAGLMTALMLNNNIPDVEIIIIRSKYKKIIGVGESTIGSFNIMITELLGIDKEDFIINVKPVTKHGVLFKFGKDDFHYTFDTAFDYEFYNEKLPIDILRQPVVFLYPEYEPIATLCAPVVLTS